MRWLVVLLAGCGGAPLPLPPEPEVVADTIEMTDARIGPLDAMTQANLVELRHKLVGYQVVPVNLDTDSEMPALEFQVFDGDKRLFEIVPTEQGGILNVHVDSPRVVIKGRPWRVGAPFTGTVTKCECWGGSPVCFKEGEHVGVTFKRACHGVTDKIRRPVEGKPIERLVWSPKPLGGNVDSDVEPPPDDILSP